MLVLIFMSSLTCDKRLALGKYKLSLNRGLTCCNNKRYFCTY